ncbi:MAG: hypothetical protein AAF682_24475, partial [Planctomycetota bacterium]
GAAVAVRSRGGPELARRPAVATGPDGIALVRAPRWTSDGAGAVARIHFAGYLPREVRLGAPVTQVALRPGARLDLRLQPPLGPGTRVDLRAAGDRPGSGAPAGFSAAGADGRWSRRGLAPGPVEVAVFEEVVAGVPGGPGRWSSPRRVVLRGGETSRVELGPTPRHPLRVLFATDGAPLAGAVVRLPGGAAAGATDGAGALVLADVLAGPLTLCVERDGAAPWCCEVRVPTAPHAVRVPAAER